MKEIIILGGPNGAGKSTLATQLMQNTGYPFVNADEIERSLPAAKGSAVRAGRHFFAQLNAFAAQNDSFILESTLSGKYLESYFLRWKKQGYVLSLVFVFLESAEACKKRVQVRVAKGGHAIPEAVIERRYARSLRNFWEVYKELVDEWALLYNSELGTLDVAFSAGESFAVSDDNLFSLFKEVIKNHE